MEGEAGATQGDGGRQRSAVAHSAARRGGISVADQLCERCESAACSRQCERARNGYSASDRGCEGEADLAAYNRRLASFAAWGNRRTSRSVLREGVSVADFAGEPAAAQ